MSKKIDFIEASRAGDIVEVERLLPEIDLFPQDWDEPDEHPLLVACGSGDFALVQRLLASPQAEDVAGRKFVSRTEIHSLTALAVALMHGNTAVARLLVELGADVNAEFRTTLACAEEVEIAAAFGDFNHGRSIGICWWLADDDLVQTMLAHGLNPDAMPRNGHSALIGAIERGNLRRLNQLLAIGADPNETISNTLADRTGDALPAEATALMYAAFAYRASQAIATRVRQSDPSLLASRLEIVSALLRAGSLLSLEFSDYVDGMRSRATVCDWVLAYGDEALLEIFGLQCLRQRLHEDAAERDSGDATFR